MQGGRAMAARAQNAFSSELLRSVMKEIFFATPLYRYLHPK